MLLVVVTLRVLYTATLPTSVRLTIIISSRVELMKVAFSYHVKAELSLIDHQLLVIESDIAFIKVSKMSISFATRINSLFSRLNPIESAKVNQGAIYIATSRTMATSEVGSGAGKGGGSGGRYVLRTRYL